MTTIARATLVSVLGGVLACCNARNTPAESELAPVEVDFTENAGEFEVGSDVQFTVTLRNSEGQVAVAPADIPVVLRSPAGGNWTTTIRKGAKTSAIHWRPAKAGVFQITASAPGLAGESRFVPVKDVKEAGSHSTGTVPATGPGPAAGAKPVEVLPPPPPSMPVMSRKHASSSVEDAPALRLYVEPEPVDELNKTWTADVSFMLQTSTGALRNAVQDIPIVLTSRVSRLSPEQVTLPAGKATSRATPVHLVANHLGEDEIQAVSTIGSVSQKVHFRPAFPAAIAVNISPVELIGDGRSQATVSVRLIDSNRHLRSADEDVAVDLATTRGALEKTSVVIPKGTTAANTTITSTSLGIATITADAADLDEGTAVVTFVMPVHLVLLAVVGGILGAYIRAGRPGRSFNRRVLETLALGGATGLVFWLILLFGTLRATAALPFNPNAVPAANELGALLLGVGGGWLGRTFFSRVAHA
jgi:hypothetical protein